MCIEYKVSLGQNAHLLCILPQLRGKMPSYKKKKKKDLYTTFLANVILNVHVRYMLSAVRLSVVCL